MAAFNPSLKASSSVEAPGANVIVEAWRLLVVYAVLINDRLSAYMIVV